MTNNRYWKLKEQKAVDLYGTQRIAIHLCLPDGRMVLCPDRQTAQFIMRCVNKHLRTIIQGTMTTK